MFNIYTSFIYAKRKNKGIEMAFSTLSRYMWTYSNPLMDFRENPNYVILRQNFSDKENIQKNHKEYC